MVEFFSPQCGHCHRLAPEYEKMAKELGSMVKVCAVDCTLNFKACQGIKGEECSLSNFRLSHDKILPIWRSQQSQKGIG